jgi:alkanesulfonate monooxygenase SsuD/methylene tetrahydromethanopterin reductase-like flavin-dependent oxidoreductase (luciferase family)
MKIGLHIVQTTWHGGAPLLRERLGLVAGAAEAAGFDLISVPDHFWQSTYIGSRTEPHLEAYTTLGFLAARTTTVRLLALATAASYRSPGLLAKAVTTLDVLSGGRAMLGIGAGDDAEEAAGLGLPYPSLGARFDLVEDAVRVCLAMWEGEHGTDAPVDGLHVHLDRAMNAPQSLTRPHPPILIAGKGERRTLPLVARYGGACNLPPSPEIPRQLDLLRRLCDQAGTDYDAIEKTAPFGFDVGEDGTKARDVVEQLRWLGSMGIDTVIGWVVGVDRVTPLEVMGSEVIPAVRDITAAGR